MNEWWRELREDLRANRGNRKGRFIVASYRTARHARGPGARPRAWSIPLVAAHRLVVEWVLGVELPSTVDAGPGLRVYHGHGLVVHDHARLGRDVVLRHSTTIGILVDDQGRDSLAPTIGDRVSIGPGVIVLGPLCVGDDAVIGAGSVVLDDIPARAVVAGNPARMLRMRDEAASA